MATLRDVGVPMSADEIQEMLTDVRAVANEKAAQNQLEHLEHLMNQAIDSMLMDKEALKSPSWPYGTGNTTWPPTPSDEWILVDMDDEETIEVEGGIGESEAEDTQESSIEGRELTEEEKAWERGKRAFGQ